MRQEPKDLVHRNRAGNFARSRATHAIAYKVNTRLDGVAVGVLIRGALASAVETAAAVYRTTAVAKKNLRRQVYTYAASREYPNDSVHRWQASRGSGQLIHLDGAGIKNGYSPC